MIVWHALQPEPNQSSHTVFTVNSVIVVLWVTIVKPRSVQPHSSKPFVSLLTFCSSLEMEKWSERERERGGGEREGTRARARGSCETL